MKTTSNGTIYCPYCGAECEAENRQALDFLREKADKIGYAIRCKAGRKGVFEIINDHGFAIGEGTSVEKIGNLLDVLNNPVFDEVSV